MSLSGTSQTYLPPTLDGLNIIEADQIYIDGTLVDITNLVPYTGSNRTINLNSQNIQTTHSATAGPDLVNLTTLQNAIAYIDVTIGNTFLNKTTTDAQNVAGEITFNNHINTNGVVTASLLVKMPELSLTEDGISIWTLDPGTTATSDLTFYDAQTYNSIIFKGTGKIQAKGYIDTDATANTVAIYDANKEITSSAVTSTELGYLTGSTSNIQAQINAIIAGSSVSLSGNNVWTSAGSNIFNGPLTLSGQISGSPLPDFYGAMVKSTTSQTPGLAFFRGSDFYASVYSYLSGTDKLLGIAGTGGTILYGNGTYCVFPSTNSFTGQNTFTNTLTVSKDLAYADRASNPFTYSFVIKTATTSQRLYMGSYYTGGSGACSALQSSDYYSSTDHGSDLLINPLGGFVGIGKSSPGYSLDVNGTVRASNRGLFGYQTGAKRGIFIDNEDSYGGCPCIQGVSPSFGANQITINPAGGAVGIGTTNPYTLFHTWASSTGKVASIITNSNGAVGSSACLQFGIWSGAGSGTGANAPSAEISAINQNSANSNTDLAFSTFTGVAVSPNYTLVERMRILANGNVGIGTTNATYKLTVQGDAYVQTTLTTGPSLYMTNTSFLVGGSTAYQPTTSYAPVKINVDPSWQNGSFRFWIVRHDIHENGSSSGSLHSYFEGHNTNWGNGSEYFAYQVTNTTRIFIGYARPTDQTNEVIVWLRAGYTYHFIGFGAYVSFPNDTFPLLGVVTSSNGNETFYVQAYETYPFNATYVSYNNRDKRLIKDGTINFETKNLGVNTNPIFGKFAVNHPSGTSWNTSTWGYETQCLITNDSTTSGSSSALALAYAGTYSWISSLSPGTSWRDLVIGAGTTYMAYYGTAVVALNSGGWAYISDQREKDDIKDLNTSSSLKRVLSAKPKHYLKKYKEDGTPIPDTIKEKRCIGFLAQDLLESNNHCVCEWEKKDNEEDDTDTTRLAVNYTDYVVHLVASTQEIHKMIESQKETINTLQNKLSQTETAFNDYKKITDERLNKLGSLVQQLLERAL